MAEVAEWRPLEFKPLDSRKLNEPSSRDIGGVSVTVYASPYDVPEAIYIYGSPDRRRYYRIEFRYIGGKEEDTWQAGKEYLRFWLGRHSRRLYAIDFDAEHVEADEVDKAIDELSNEPHRPPRTGNYEIVKKVLRSLFDRADNPITNLAH